MHSHENNTLNYDAFRQNLANLISAKGLLRKDVADDIGCTHGTITRYMRGDRAPDIEFVYRLCKYFGVTMDWMLGISPKTYSGFTPETKKIVDLYTHASESDQLVIRTILQKYENTVK